MELDYLTLTFEVRWRIEEICKGFDIYRSGKPGPERAFEEAFFCYPGQELVEQDQCRPKARRARENRAAEEVQGGGRGIRK